MKLHIDVELKTVAVEGKVSLATLFNYLKSWMPESWDEFELIPYVPTIQYKEVIVEREVYRNPYWNPWKRSMFYGPGIDVSTSIINPCYTTNSQATINFNNLTD